MAVTATPYGAALTAIATGALILTTDTLKVMLATSSYNPNVDTDSAYAAVSGNEVTSTGYTAGGATLTGVSATYDAANNWTLLSANPVTWSGVTLTARYAVVYKPSGALVGYIDFGENKSYSSEDLQLTFSNGFLRLKLPA